MSNSSLHAAGLNGYDWAGRTYASDSALAYVLYFIASDVYPSNGNSRWHGFPVGCSVGSDLSTAILIIPGCCNYKIYKAGTISILPIAFYGN